VRAIGRDQREDLPFAPGRKTSRELERRGKKNAVTIHQEVHREIDALLPVVFAERRKTGALDIEAVELALRSALHAAGAAGLSELLRDAGPMPASVPCPCGGKARYKDRRPKPIITVLGAATMRRPYYWCARCRQGQFGMAPRSAESFPPVPICRDPLGALRRRRRQRQIEDRDFLALRASLAHRDNVVSIGHVDYHARGCRNQRARVQGHRAGRKVRSPPLFSARKVRRAENVFRKRLAVFLSESPLRTSFQENFGKNA